MEEIKLQEYKVRQLEENEPDSVDVFYINVAKELLALADSDEFCTHLSPGIAKRIALTLSDYLRDVVCDMGLWRAFVQGCRGLYGYSVPFHDCPESYVDYELNAEDVRFLVWYVTAMYSDNELRTVYPHRPDLLAFADKCFSYLDGIYDDAPASEEISSAFGLDFKDPDDHAKISHLGHWLFMHSYLLTPAFAKSMQQMLITVNPAAGDFNQQISGLLENAYQEDTTGPLALFIPEWLYLMVNGRIPKQKIGETSGNIHPYYEKFVAATGGEVIKFFKTYDEMNAFFIEALGWEKGKRHLEMAADSSNFVLLVNREKGMLMARDVAQYINAPGNPCYDPIAARTGAFSMLTERGLCPGDLLRFVVDKGWFPDTSFPGSDDTALVKDNLDFIARCYLQLYYRGD